MKNNLKLFMKQKKKLHNKMCKTKSVYVQFKVKFNEVI